MPTKIRPIGALGDSLGEDLKNSLGLPEIKLQTPSPDMKAASADEKKAQESRSEKYGIAIKEGGNVTKPSEWKDVPDSKFGDPVNYSYPCPDADQTRAALRYWGKSENKSRYSSEEQDIITKRLEGFAKEYGIGESDDEEKKANEPEGKKDIAPESEENGANPEETSQPVEPDKVYNTEPEKTDTVEPEKIDNVEPEKTDMVEPEVVANSELDTTTDNNSSDVLNNNKSVEPEGQKDISVAGELFDEPVEWQLYDLFGAFMSACYKLSCASEATDNPMTAQYLALVDEFASLLKTTIIQVQSSDDDDLDGVSDALTKLTSIDDAEFQKALLIKLAQAAITEKAGSRHSKEDLRTLNEMRGLLEKLIGASETEEKSLEAVNAELETKQTELETLNQQIETKTSELEELDTKAKTVTQLETDVEAKTKALGELEAKIAERTEEYERITKLKLPRPDENKPDVAAHEIFATRTHKSFVSMRNEEFLGLDPLK